MHIQIVNFNLNDISTQDYENSCNEIAQAFADLPGLQSKYWLADKENNNPAFKNVSSKDFRVLEGPTKTTRG
jgi:hypothetical protein